MNKKQLKGRVKAVKGRIKEATGKLVNWGAEMGRPNALMRSGWTRNTMTVGMVVTFTGALAKDAKAQKSAEARLRQLSGANPVQGCLQQSSRAAASPVFALSARLLTQHALGRGGQRPQGHAHPAAV